MVSLRLKLRPDLPSQFLGKGISFGHWQVFVRHHFFLAPNCAHGSSQWQLEPFLVFFRLKLRPYLPTQFLGRGRSVGHWQMFGCCRDSLAPNSAHGSSSQWQLEPNSMVFFRSKVRSDPPHIFWERGAPLGTGRCHTNNNSLQLPIFHMKVGLCPAWGLACHLLASPQRPSVPWTTAWT